MSVGMLLPLLVADLVLFVVVFADLHEAWLAKDSYFFSVLVLTIVSSLWYLLASVIDPGILPKAPLDKKLLATFKSKALAAGILKVSGSGLLEASLEDMLMLILHFTFALPLPSYISPVPPTASLLLSSLLVSLPLFIHLQVCITSFSPFSILFPSLLSCTDVAVVVLSY